MFTKLRNKFLILNMAMTSTVMIIAFAAIYIVSYNNVNSEIATRLNQQAVMQSVIIEGTELPDDTENSKPKAFNRRFSPDDSYSFIIQVDGNGEILEIDSPFNLNEETYKKATDIAWSNKKSSSAITLEGKEWRYAISKMKKQVIQGNGHSYTVWEKK